MSNHILSQILERLKLVKGPNDSGFYQALCPYHDDHRQSLSLNEAGFTCFGCGQRGNLQKLAIKLGIPTEQERKILTIYDYLDKNGKLVYQVVRYAPKNFLQRRPDPSGKGWIWNLQGVDPIPYRLPELIASPKDSWIFIPEGEKDCDNLAKFGLVATTNSGGAGKWRQEFAKYFAGRKVVILPDNDEPGRKHAEAVARSLYGTASDVRIVNLPDLPEKGDISDWLAAGGTKEELLRLVQESSEWRPHGERTAIEVMTAQELLNMQIPEPVEIVPGILVEGVTVFAGKPKLGKSWAALGIAIAVATGGYAFGCIQVKQRGVLYLALEDSKRRLQDRVRILLKNAPPPPNLYISRVWPRLDQEGDMELDKFLTDHPEVKLVIIDIFERIRERKTNDRGKTLYNLDYASVAKLKAVTDKHGASLLLVHHTNRGEHDDPIDMLSGSSGIAGAADSVLVLKRTRGKADAELFVVGRDIEERTLALRADPHVGGWVLLGDAEEYKISRERQAVIEALKANGEPMSPKQIALALGQPYENVKMLLSRMVKNGEIKALDRGKYTVVKEGYFGYHVTSVTSVTTVTSEKGNQKVTEGNTPPLLPF
ncbi:MAG: AAA family ATPase [Firmicutes bacterium]|nr:AAA family ATPase [Bacillota bacterium]